VTPSHSISTPEVQSDSASFHLDDLLGPGPFPVTFSKGLRDIVPKVRTVTLRKLAGYISTKQAETKAGLPMLKLARMEGGVSTVNVKAFSGAIADYDGAGGVTLANAAARLREAGVAALVYTSPSSTANLPRWRALAPYSRELGVDEHLAMTDRLNGALGGIIDDPASWSVHQRFYFGQARLRDESKGGGDADPVEVKLVEGSSIDRLDGITPAPRPNGVHNHTEGDSGDLTALLWTPRGHSIEKICEVLTLIPNGSEEPQDWKRYNSVSLECNHLQRHLAVHSDLPDGQRPANSALDLQSLV